MIFIVSVVEVGGAPQRALVGASGELEVHICPLLGGLSSFHCTIWLCMSRW